MIRIHNTAYVPYTISQVKSVVMAIDDYHDFLPGCSVSKITGTLESGEVLAELGVRVGIMNITFVSKVTHSSNRVVSVLHKGNFIIKSLKNIWNFERLKDKTRVDIDTVFDIRSPYRPIVASKIKQNLEQFSQAFIDRAHKIYGQSNE